ncbi:MAG: hypothetical protein KA118_11050 [Verrucomicrobia bacterium]|nr:hypothetical protein [Verrucomicrobiota bacterium]
MTAAAAHGVIRLELAQPLGVRLFRSRGGPMLACEAVRGADWMDAASEAWRDGCLRTGHPGAPLSETRMQLSPIFAEEVSSRCAGFRIEVAPPDGAPVECLFTLACLRPAAHRMMAALVAGGVLQADEQCLFDVVADPPELPAEPPPSSGIAMDITLRSPALRYLRKPLGPLLERATPVAPIDAGGPVVFYTRDALARCEACARRGAEAGLESGGALFGSLVSCPETGEFFSIVHDAVEVEETDAQRLSLSYTSRSWQILQEIQRDRQEAFPLRAERLLGQAHGHPFRPEEGKVCAECEKLATCAVTSAWASHEDQIWHKAVFARQPWALCHVFGLTARGEPVHQLFGLKDGRLQARGFHLLPGFDFDE